MPANFTKALQAKIDERELLAKVLREQEESQRRSGTFWKIVFVLGCSSGITYVMMGRSLPRADAKAVSVAIAMKKKVTLEVTEQIQQRDKILLSVSEGGTLPVVPEKPPEPALNTAQVWSEGDRIRLSDADMMGKFPELKSPAMRELALSQADIAHAYHAFSPNLGQTQPGDRRPATVAVAPQPGDYTRVERLPFTE